jgi:hypothetical protein
MENVYKLAVAIGDDFYPKKVDKCFFIVLDKLYMPSKYNNTMTWIRNQEYYVNDYPYDDIETGRMQVLVIKVPKEFHRAYDLFLLGKYSLMYDDETIEKYFYDDDELRPEVKRILRRSPLALDGFVKKLKASFGNDLKVSREDFQDAEYDFPPQLKYEILNKE